MTRHALFLHVGHRTLIGISLLEVFEAPSRRYRKPIGILLHDTDHLASAFADGIIGLNCFIKLEDKYRTFWIELAGLQRRERIIVGVDVMKSPKGIVVNMPL